WDLTTGRELWRRPIGYLSLGDVTADGRVTAISNDYHSGRIGVTGDSVELLDVRTGRLLWRRPLPGPRTPIAIQGGRVDLTAGGDLSWVEGACPFVGGRLVRLRLSDGVPIPTPIAPLDGWSEPAFMDDRIVFGGLHQLYMLDLSDPPHGTKYYNGGI